MTSIVKQQVKLKVLRQPGKSTNATIRKMKKTILRRTTRVIKCVERQPREKNTAREKSVARRMAT